MKNSEHFYVRLAYIYYQNSLSYSVSITECLRPSNECTVQDTHTMIFHRMQIFSLKINLQKVNHILWISLGPFLSTHHAAHPFYWRLLDSGDV